MRSIGETIKAKRLALGMSADELADKLGKSRATIYRYESADVENMPVGVLEPLAKALNTTPTELMGWGDTDSVTKPTAALDKDSLVPVLTQSFSRFPKVVQEELIRRLYKLDITFSQNVNKLLLCQRDYNRFMDSTKISPQTFGDLLKGVPTLTTSDEAESIAAFFEVDVIDLFFNCAEELPVYSKTKPDENKPSTVNKTEKSPQQHPDKEAELSGRDKKIYQCIKKKAEKDVFIMINLKHYKNILLDKRVNNLINKVIAIITTEYTEDTTDLGLRPIYKAIADEIIETNFIEKYLTHEQSGMSFLISAILERIHAK